MKTAGSILFCLVVTPALVAGEPALSVRLKAEVRANLPAYAPPPARPQPDAPAAATPADPDVLELPKFTVREKRLPKGDPDLWRSGGEIQRIAMKNYKDSMTPLEWAMNCWFVPLFSALPSARARAAYKANKLAEELGTFARLADVGKLADPKNSADLKKAVGDMEQADERQNRPAGSK